MFTVTSKKVRRFFREKRQEQVRNAEISARNPGYFGHLATPETRRIAAGHLRSIRTRYGYRGLAWRYR